MLTGSGSVTSSTVERFRHTCNTSGGDSGAGITIAHPKLGKVIVGVHTIGVNLEISATRITEEKLAQIDDWITYG